MKEQGTDSKVDRVVKGAAPEERLTANDMTTIQDAYRYCFSPPCMRK